MSDTQSDTVPTRSGVPPPGSDQQTQSTAQEEQEEKELDRLPVGTPGLEKWLSLTDEQRRSRQQLADEDDKKLFRKDWFGTLGPAAQKTCQLYPRGKFYVCAETGKPCRILGVSGDGEQLLCLFFFKTGPNACYKIWLPTKDIVQVSKYTAQQLEFIRLRPLFAPVFLDPLGTQLL